MTAETYYVLKVLTALIFEIFCPLRQAVIMVEMGGRVVVVGECK